MNTKTKVNYKANQGILPLFFSDFLNINDPVLVFDKFMEGIDCSKYLKNIPVHETGRIRYNPVDMLKTVLFGFMTSGYMSLRELEDNCRVNIRFMYLMNNEKPSYRTFGYFINEVLKGSIRKIFIDVNKTIFEEEHDCWFFGFPYFSITINHVGVIVSKNNIVFFDV